MEKERKRLEITIPYPLSLIITHSLDGKVQGLKEFLPGDRPNSLIVFWSFRLMLAIGFLHVPVMVWAAIL